MEKILGAMQTPDGYWRVEVYRVPRSAQQWFRLIHAQTVLIEKATIGQVQDALGEAYADLQQVTEDVA